MATVFKFEPLKGFGPLRLGSPREEAREAMSKAGYPLEASHGALDYFCRNSIQTETGSDGCVIFIGVSYDDRFVAQYRGLNVFDTPAQDLFRAIAEADQSGEHRFNDYDYCFPNQILTLWDADVQYDRLQHEKRQIWAQVGLGNSAYAAATAKGANDA